MKKYRQYHLMQGKTQMVTWLKSEEPLPIGARLSLKEQGKDGVWTVAKAGQKELDQPPVKTWKVGGLS